MKSNIDEYNTAQMISRSFSAFTTGLVHRGGYLCFLLALTLVFTGAFSDRSFALKTPSIKAKTAILMDVDTNSVLFEKNADKLLEPASMSKLMTLAVLFNAVKTGHVGLDDEFQVSEYAWRTGGARSRTASMLLPLNSYVRMEDLLRGIVIQSGNDACIVAAEGLMQTEAAFAETMTKYARRIGLKKSTFANSTGLPDPDHLMTARELALLSIHIVKDFPEYYHYFSEKTYTYNKKKFYNRNPLVFGYGADGLKTGYTKNSGYGLVASKVKNGRRLIVVVSGLKKSSQRKKDAIALLNWGFRNFRSYKIFDRSDSIAKARVVGGENMYMPLVAKDHGPVHVLLPRTLTAKKVRASVVYQGPLKPPVREGQQVAHLKIQSRGAATNLIPLYAGKDMKSGSTVWRGVDTLLFQAFGWLF